MTSNQQLQLLSHVTIEAERVEPISPDESTRPYWVARFTSPAFPEVDGTGYSLPSAVQSLFDETAQVTLIGVAMAREQGVI